MTNMTAKMRYIPITSSLLLVFDLSNYFPSLFIKEYNAIVIDYFIVLYEYIL
ncbi:hypothetical protein [Salipaludibacillus neizhouensis]|uniref:hypothetical protein n=1 Tax=Salipaludibacillus neizhouensis TaxID=885475 RepID=UPI001600B8F4|nr:hypothetical protein [Salipaludibacillus neizhouensis]